MDNINMVGVPLNIVMDYIAWDKILVEQVEYVVNNIDQINEIVPSVYFMKASRNSKLDRRVIVAYADKMDWRYLYKTKRVNMGLIRDCKDKLDWSTICRLYKFNSEELDEFADYLDWDNVSLCQNLEPWFIETYRDRLREDYLEINL